MTYIPLPQKEEGGQKKVWTSDDDVRELLLQMLNQLKIMNAHLQTITDENILEGEL